MRLVFLGPPGVGKGTQAAGLARDLSIPHISTGAILRDALQRGTATGLEAKKYMDAGELVPDEVVLALVRDRFAEDDASAGWLLDGFCCWASCCMKSCIRSTRASSSGGSPASRRGARLLCGEGPRASKAREASSRSEHRKFKLPFPWVR